MSLKRPFFTGPSGLLNWLNQNIVGLVEVIARFDDAGCADF